MLRFCSRLYENAFPKILRRWKKIAIDNFVDIFFSQNHSGSFFFAQVSDDSKKGRKIILSKKKIGNKRVKKMFKVPPRPPSSGRFSIESSWPTGYRVSLVSVSVSGSKIQVPETYNVFFLQIGKLLQNTFQNIAHLLRPKNQFGHF